MMQRGIPAPDSLRAALDSVFAQPAYQWEAPRDPFAFVTRAWNTVRDWIERMQAQNPMLVRALWWVLLAVLALILLHAAWVASDSTVAAAARRGNAVQLLDVTTALARAKEGFDLAMRAATEPGDELADRRTRGGKPSQRKGATPSE